MTTNEQGRAAKLRQMADELSVYSYGDGFQKLTEDICDELRAIADAAEHAPGVMTPERIDRLIERHVDPVATYGGLCAFARAIEQESRAPLLARIAELERHVELGELLR